MDIPEGAYRGRTDWVARNFKDQDLPTNLTAAAARKLRLVAEAEQLAATDPVAAKRLQELMPKGFNAYPILDIDACIRRARTHSQVKAMNLPPMTAEQLWGPG